MVCPEPFFFRLERTHGNPLVTFALFPRPQLVFNWTRPSTSASDDNFYSDDLDVIHAMSDDEGESQGKAGGDEEVTTAGRQPESSSFVCF